MLQAIE